MTTPMGPGFFIFFENDAFQTQGGAIGIDTDFIEGFDIYGIETYKKWMLKKRLEDEKQSEERIEETEVQPEKQPERQYRQFIYQQINEWPEAVEKISTKENVTPKVAKEIMAARLEAQMQQMMELDDEESFMLILISSLH